jgi:hypothetical protein
MTDHQTNNDPMFPAELMMLLAAQKAAEACHDRTRARWVARRFGDQIKAAILAYFDKRATGADSAAMNAALKVDQNGKKNAELEGISSWLKDRISGRTRPIPIFMANARATFSACTSSWKILLT